MPDPGLKLMVYDSSCRGPLLFPGLTHTWIVGAWLYHGLGRLDAWRGAQSWDEALHWIIERSSGRRIAEVQIWCHGQWGNARLRGDLLDARSLAPRHPHHDSLSLIASRMLEGESGLWWFRTCQTYGAVAGMEFAQQLTEFLGCRTAGHTFIIGPWHSGLHSLLPGQAPSWSASEGISQGTPLAPTKALWSRPGRPNTITCLHGSIPPGF